MTKQRNHTIAVVGANGQVGTELCILLRERGFDVRPIVRNRIAASTFDQHGFDYQIGSVTNADDAQRLLESADTVVIAAFVPWFFGKNPRPARKTNKQIIKNVVKYAPADANQIYFSTLVAFGSEIGLNDWHWYGREKKRIESEFEKYCDNYNSSGYVLRLGHVYGPTQDHTRELISELSGRDFVRLPIASEKPSNIISTVTLSHIVEDCAIDEVTPGRYSAVNIPQWSWSDVIEHYVPSVNVRYEPEIAVDHSDKSLVKRTIGELMAPLREYKELLITPLHLVPDRISYYLNTVRNSREIQDSMNQYEQRITYQHRHFKYEPVPGPRITPSSETDLEQGESVLRSALINR
jgi:dTDP-4-dehydrorhamnose reductase